MNAEAIFNGLLGYVCLLIVLTFHEFAHAWTAWKFGDDTARLQGRVSLNPIVHMDSMGTVMLPLLVVLLQAADSRLAGFIIGWGKPVPVNPYNLRHRRWQDTLVALAGPAMNVVVAGVAVGLARGFQLAHIGAFAEVAQMLAVISLLLCFFNLLPVPPLDGSHLFKNLIGMSDELYMRISRFGLLIVILLLQIPIVRAGLWLATSYTFVLMRRMAGLE
ncbi:MAG: site-2 protease family protein [Verrucomicrobia bacterium]|mgnify:FL=1|jgi:Zn-dependent protease|nr:site-2 protease family protein [Verrucomicrobiota bacterium]OQC68058.1 MAG: Peptidase family M50 [Verrucomicrobia bacterium ADurb.Bin006]MDI9379346.1 site-2 protease family protein [Verrucomicrobiota bacterium]NMD19010.1 site-2 protease family protein [Verrucomicrobiota bacterium]HOA61025.1 site-2 protease family protein [Verrucomicrobiota bacterium]